MIFYVWVMIAEVFNKCKDEKGRFKESLTISDACGLLGFHEAAHFRLWEEDILDEALAFTTTHLKSMVEHLEYPLAAQVSMPYTGPLQRLGEARGKAFHIYLPR